MVVRIIRGDKEKTQAYCQIKSLGGEVDVAAQREMSQKADVLTKRINDLEKRPSRLSISGDLVTSESLGQQARS